MLSSQLPQSFSSESISPAIASSSLRICAGADDEHKELMVVGKRRVVPLAHSRFSAGAVPSAKCDDA